MSARSFDPSKLSFLNPREPTTRKNAHRGYQPARLRARAVSQTSQPDASATPRKRHWGHAHFSQRLRVATEKERCIECIHGIRHGPIGSMDPRLRGGDSEASGGVW